MSRCSTPRLSLGDCICEPHCRIALALRGVATALLGDATFIFGQCGKGVGARPSECPLELGRPQLGFPRDHVVERRLTALDLDIEQVGVRSHTPQRNECADEGNKRDCCGNDGDGGGGHAR